jgi:hypothetical protein
MVVLCEVIHELKRTHAKGIVWKLDFKKAYNKVHWPFLKYILWKKWFCDKRINGSCDGEGKILRQHQMARMVITLEQLGALVIDIHFPLYCLTSLLMRWV